MRPVPPQGGLAVAHRVASSHGMAMNIGSIAIVPCGNAYIYSMRTIKDAIYQNNVFYMSVWWLPVVGGMVANNGNVPGGVRRSWG